MVHIANDIAAQIANAKSRGVPKGASIQLKNDLPPNLQGKIIKGRVEGQNNDGSYRLQLSSGKTVDAQINPPPKIGSQISFVQLKSGEAKLTEMVVDTLKKEGDASQNQNKQQMGQQKSSGEQSSFLNQNNKNNVLKAQNTPQPPDLTPKTQGDKPQITNQNLNQTATQVQQTNKQDPFSNLRPLVGQSVPVKGLDGKPLPIMNNALTVVVSKPENGQQTLRPQASATQLPAFKATFPTTVPEQTVLKLNITGQNAKILEVTPPKVEAQAATTTTKAETQPLPQTKLSNAQIQNIILSAKVTAPTKPLPIGVSFDVQNINASEKIPNITQTITNKSGEKIQEQVPQFRTVLTTTGGQKFNVTTQEPISANTPIRLQVTESGMRLTQVLQTPVTLPHHATQTLPQSLQKGQPLTVQVLGMASSRSAQVQLPSGNTLEIPTQTSLNANSKVQIQLTDDDLLEILPQSLPTDRAKTVTLTELANSWQSLKKSIDVLQRVHPEGAQTMKDGIPNLSKETLLPNMLSFIDAVNNQTLQRISGDETLNLLKALGIDFSADLFGLQSASSKNTESPENWRAFLFPYTENEKDDPKQGGFFWHQGEDAEGQPTGTRFITHLHLEGLGETRLDGLIQEKDIQLKLMTERPLSDEALTGLKSIVGQTLEKFDYTGKIEALVSDKKQEKPIHLVLTGLNKQIQNI